jgi:hypothetical protein
MPSRNVLGKALLYGLKIPVIIRVVPPGIVKFAHRQEK